MATGALRSNKQVAFQPTWVKEWGPAPCNGHTWDNEATEEKDLASQWDKGFQPVSDSVWQSKAKTNR